MYKTNKTLTGKEWKEFVTGLDHLDDDEKYRMTFYANTIRDLFRFQWSVFRKHKAQFYYTDKA